MRKLLRVKSYCSVVLSSWRFRWKQSWFSLAECVLVNARVLCCVQVSCVVYSILLDSIVGYSEVIWCCTAFFSSDGWVAREALLCTELNCATWLAMLYRHLVGSATSPLGWQKNISATLMATTRYRFRIDVMSLVHTHPLLGRQPLLETLQRSSWTELTNGHIVFVFVYYCYS